MREVPAKLYGFMRRNALQEGLDVDAAARGLRLARVDPDRWGERVDWDELALFLDRLYEDHDDEAMIAAGESFLQVNDWIKIGARILLTPRMLYQIGWELSRPAYPHWEIEVDAWTDPIRIAVRMPTTYRGCRAMMLGTVGEMRMLPTLMGAAPAKVEADVGTHHAIYSVTVAEKLGARDKALRRGKLALEGVSREILALVEGAIRADESDGSDDVPSEGELRRAHGFTPAEARVARSLATGVSVADIAKRFGVSHHTVRAQLRSIFDKTGARSQPALVSYLLRGGAPPARSGVMAAGQSGVRADAASRSAK